MPLPSGSGAHGAGGFGSVYHVICLTLALTLTAVEGLFSPAVTARQSYGDYQSAPPMNIHTQQRQSCNLDLAAPCFGSFQTDIQEFFIYPSGRVDVDAQGGLS